MSASVGLQWIVKNTIFPEHPVAISIKLTLTGGGRSGTHTALHYS